MFSQGIYPEIGPPLKNLAISNHCQIASKILLTVFTFSFNWFQLPLKLGECRQHQWVWMLWIFFKKRRLLQKVNPQFPCSGDSGASATSATQKPEPAPHCPKATSLPPLYRMFWGTAFPSPQHNPCRGLVWDSSAPWQPVPSTFQTGCSWGCTEPSWVGGQPQPGEPALGSRDLCFHPPLCLSVPG